MDMVRLLSRLNPSFDLSVGADQSTAANSRTNFTVGPVVAANQCAAHHSTKTQPGLAFKTSSSSFTSVIHDVKRLGRTYNPPQNRPDLSFNATGPNQFCWFYSRPKTSPVSSSVSPTDSPPSNESLLQNSRHSLPINTDCNLQPNELQPDRGAALFATLFSELMQSDRKASCPSLISPSLSTMNKIVSPFNA
ncbi:hypothetical protein FGIG_04200 [Fasciola gigantica]|uniref:Uncharacterized protein n=1 Tax=Fasciola gigantica TaxID=46835 RepID=A0A504YPZ1_FASGI|nr:hypothetical protein FGIG_04200 [Fasciola gigantica]